MHGGTVQAQSPGQDQGAAFTITLPIRAVAPGGVSDAVIAETGAPPLLPAMPSLHGVRVLVVDDDASARELVQTVLADFGAEVIVACTADEGMRRLQSDRPDVLISDIGMPEEDGYTFVRKVRQLPAELGGQVAAIALTAYGHVTDRYLALSAGYDQHIAKPVIPRELAFVVAAAARKAHQD
jgi:CheY-like chemotaxis protein